MRNACNISDFGIDMIPEIPSIDPTSTCLHAENPQATAIALKWRTFKKLRCYQTLKRLACGRVKSVTRIGQICYILCQA